MIPLLGLTLLASAAATVVVAPLEGPGGEQAWVGVAIADALPHALARLDVPALDRADRLRAQEALDIPAAPLTRATSIRLAEALGAPRLVVGVYEVSQDQVSLSLRLLDVERGTLSAPLIAAGPLETLPALVDGLAWDVALSGPTRPSRTREEFAASRSPVPFEAFRAYARALATAEPRARAKQLERVLALVPTYDEARLALGRLQLETGEHGAARETFGRVSAASPLARPARFREGVALLGLGRYREATAIYENLAAQEATASVLVNQAIAVMRLGGRASPLLRRAADAEPLSPDVHFDLGWALLAEGEAEAAVFWLKGVARRDPKDQQARLVLAWALRKAGREAQADAEWRRVVAAVPSYEPLVTPDLTRRFERIRPSEHVLLAEGDGRSDVEMAASHASRAEKLLAAADAEGALAELNRAAYLDPYSRTVHLLLARLRQLRGERDEALAELRTALWAREDPVVRLELAALLKELGRGAEARAEAQKVLQTEPGSAAAKRLLEDP